mmetsp:Transcript_12157/g.20494  ORF Transcript_12157/g.20494 Transcript_12157/m.20494 type:complete len:98 (-) Transcript_12157:172-465(-)
MGGVNQGVIQIVNDSCMDRMDASYVIINPHNFLTLSKLREDQFAQVSKLIQQVNADLATFRSKLSDEQALLQLRQSKHFTLLLKLQERHGMEIHSMG